MKFVLVILSAAGSYDGGVSMSTVTGFTSLQSCIAAKNSVAVMPFGSWTHRTSSYCVELK